jgi:glycosyltransferase involved in cell wall biosynthesis
MINAKITLHNDEVLENKYKKNLAPVVIFAYNRVDHLEKTIECLKNSKYSDCTEVYVFSDGARTDKPEDIEKIQNVRLYLNGISGFKNITIIKREQNYGLAKNIILGITQIIDKYGKVIVIEDDICITPFFLQYMNDALYLYENESEIMEIGGFMPSIFENESLPETFFLPWTTSWGWATWKRSWELFERNPQKLINTISKEDKYILTMYGTENGQWKQVIRNAQNELFTWAVFFSATVVQNHGKVLYTREAVCWNIGFDGSGENCGANKAYRPQKQVEVNYFDDSFEICQSAVDVVKKHNKARNRYQVFAILEAIIRKVIGRNK